jgi:hypothetical protein
LHEIFYLRFFFHESTGFRSQQYAENCIIEALMLRIRSCGLQKKLRLRNCGVVEHHFFKSCGIAIAEVLLSSCVIAIADSKKSCACPPLEINLYTFGFKIHASSMQLGIWRKSATHRSCGGWLSCRTYSTYTRRSQFRWFSIWFTC